MKKISTFVDMNTVDPKAIEQFSSAMDQPFAVCGAIMPDIHPGYSLPIGSVVATDGVVVPSWVGYDIGCGVLACTINVDHGAVRAAADDIYAEIVRTIPTGREMYKEPIYDSFYPPFSAIAKEQFVGRNGARQLGTLGGGNHFIEIGVDERMKVWIIIHSGSRGVGHGIAGEYMRIASGSDKPKEGHYGFNTNSLEGLSYWMDMRWCLDYAFTNREIMMSLAMCAISRVTGVKTNADGDVVNRNHNHISNKNGWLIHRKGATHAEAGMMGVIPGNMSDGSFIVKGLGNPDSLWSSSHGAGRVLGRGQAKKSLTLEQFEKTMVGVKANVSVDTLDESPAAYKGIHQVMADQSDLVEIMAHVVPIINVKG